MYTILLFTRIRTKPLFLRTKEIYWLWSQPKKNILFRFAGKLITVRFSNFFFINIYHFFADFGARVSHKQIRCIPQGEQPGFPDFPISTTHHITVRAWENIARCLVLYVHSRSDMACFISSSRRYIMANLVRQIRYNSNL